MNFNDGMGYISKALGAAVGGATVASAGIAFLPDNVEAPWWGYIIMYAVAMLIPAVTTYLAAPNNFVDPGVVVPVKEAVVEKIAEKIIKEAK